MKKISILFFTIPLLFLFHCNKKETKHESLGKLMVTAPINKDTLITREYVCQIRSIQHIELRALEKGYIQNMYVDEGKFVKKGQILFRITPTLYKADVDKAMAELKFVETEYKNTKSLAESNIVSKSELTLAKAKLDKAKAEYDLASAHLKFTEIRAPFGGIVGKFNDVRLGSLVDEGDLITTLSDNNKMWVYFNVPEVEYLDFALNKKKDDKPKVYLQLANNQMYNEEGFVETIESDFNNETGNIAFRATFNNPNKILRHGETGNIHMPTKIKNALLIPQKATFEVLDKKMVFVVKDNGKIESREIEIAHEMPHLYVVRKGIKKGEKILVDGLRKVKNGDTIEFHFKKMTEIIKEQEQLHAE